MDSIAQLRFLEHKFIDTQVKIDPARDVNSDFQVNLESKVMDMESDCRMRLDLTTSISDSERVVEINVTVSAIFEYDKSMTKEAKENFFKYNAPAIVFPFLRAYINAVTSLAGIKPIVLPTINFSAKQ